MARPTISLQAAIGPTAATTGVFIIGVSLIGSVTDLIGARVVVGQGSFEELADRCLNVSTRRGRQREFEQYRAGTLTALFDNADGALDPSWDDGPYSDGGVSMIRAFAVITLTATWDGVDYDLIYAFADGWRPTYRYPEGGLVDLAATDAFKLFTKIDPLEQSAVGGGDTTGDRLDRILDIAEWPDGLRDLDVGSATHQETTLASPLATQMRLAADSERGDLYLSGDGKVTHRGRLAKYTSTRSTGVQWTIGDGADMFNPASFDAVTDDALVYNDVHVSRTGGEMVTRQDPDVADAPYLWVSYTRTDLTLEDDNQVADYADDVLLHNKGKNRPRVASVTFEPDGNDALWPLVLGARFGDRITFSATHPFTGELFEGDYFIEGGDHDIPVLESGGKWVTTLYLDDADTYPSNPFIIGVSLIGGTDVLV